MTEAEKRDIQNKHQEWARKHGQSSLKGKYKYFLAVFSTTRTSEYVYKGESIKQTERKRKYVSYGANMCNGQTNALNRFLSE